MFIAQKIQLEINKYYNTDASAIWQINHSEGQLIEVRNGELDGFLFGNVIYRGLIGKHAARKLLEDYCSKSLSKNEVLGSFVMILRHSSKLVLIQDPLKMHSLYYCRKSGRISDSLQKLVDTSAFSYSLNRRALNERVVLGFSLSNETILNGIIRLDSDSDACEDSITLYSWSDSARDVLETHGNRNLSINRNLELLNSQFSTLSKVFSGDQVDLGLSSGFDCRLLLACADAWLPRISLHSHKTIGVHDLENSLAREVANVLGYEIYSIPTSDLVNESDDVIGKTLKENLSFFDGVSARHLGSFSKTYTASYRELAINGSACSLNGLGGEIFRDSYFVGSRRLSWDAWSRRLLELPLGREYFGSGKDYIEVSLNSKEIIERRLDMSFDNPDLLKSHLYYGLVKMPAANGSVSKAYNKVSHTYFPFINSSIIEGSLKAVPYIKGSVSYQADMIKRMSPKLAKVSSHYGYSFDRIPLKIKLMHRFKSNLPVDLRERLVKEHYRKSISSNQNKEFFDLVKRSSYLSNIKDELMTIFPRMNFELVMSNGTQRRVALFLGSFLVENKTKIDGIR